MGADQGLTRLFFDGSCGFCSGAVRFVARRDSSDTIRFAPLGGETFQRLISEGDRAGLPDSLVVLTPEGDRLVRSAALIHLLRRMGPGWRFLGKCLTWMPRFFLNGIYRLVARLRHSKPACSTHGLNGDHRLEP